MSKRMKFLYIYRIDQQKEIPLTYVKNIKQAKEFIYAYYFMSHVEHFNAWCECHQRPNKNLQDFCYYAQTVIGIQNNPDNIQIVPVWFNQDDFVVILRAILGNSPIGTTYETEEELAFFKGLKNCNLTN